MDNQDTQPVYLHRIEVDRDEHGPTAVKFVCDGDDSAPCHHWPDCGCETWGTEHGWPDGTPMPGHGNVQQPTCWQDPWFNDALGSGVPEWLEAWEGDEYGPPEGDDLVSGPIDTTFQGDYMTWEYAPVRSMPRENHNRTTGLDSGTISIGVGHG